MMSVIEEFWNLLYQRDIISKEQLVTEALRVVKTYRHINKGNGIGTEHEDKNQIFEVMKTVSEKAGLGYFPGDRDYFLELYNIGKDMDILEYAIRTYHNDRSGMVFVPRLIPTFIANMLDNDQVHNILIAEAEKCLRGLGTFVAQYTNKTIVLTVDTWLMYQVLSTSFEKYLNLQVLHISVYRKLELLPFFDVIFSVPAFGGRLTIEETGNGFISRDTEGIAVQNLLKHLSEIGKLYVVTPAKFTFAGGPMAQLRKWIMDKFSIDAIYSLPEGIFRPYTSIKTYLFCFSSLRAEVVKIGTLDIEEDELCLGNTKAVSVKEFNQFDDWRIEFFLSEDQEGIKRFIQSETHKVKMKELAETFRGKAIMKNNIKPGEFSILNISNIEDGEILFDSMDTIDEEERKLKRYELVAGDVVITCRGILNKVAVFPTTVRKVIASANVIVIRPKQDINSEYLKIFLESLVGETLLKSFQRGSTIMNINPSDIGEMEVLIPPLNRQIEIAQHYIKGLLEYRESIRTANSKWTSIKNNSYDKVLD